MSRSSSPRATLARIFSRPEVWAFGFTNFMIWPLVAFTVQGIAGRAAPWVWLVGAAAGTITLLQIRPLVTQWPSVTGGVPGYISRLFPDHPRIGLYAAMGYFWAWLLIIPISAVTVSDLVTRQLGVFGVTVPPVLIRVAFLLFMAAVAFGGSRALSMLHLILLVPTIAILAAFVVSGLLAEPVASIVPTAASPTSPAALVGTLFVVMFVTYGMETSAAFSPEGPSPLTVRQCLLAAAALLIPGIVGGGWVLLRHTPGDFVVTNLFDAFASVATGFWGGAAPGLITMMLVAGAILSSATALAMCPRMLYQQSADGLLAPWLGRVSARSVLREPLFVCLLLSLPLMFVRTRFLVSIGIGAWVVAYGLFHLGLWRNRREGFVLWPRFALGLAILDALVLLLGGPVVGWVSLGLSLAIPGGLILLDRLFQYLPVPTPRDPPSDAPLTRGLRAAVPTQIGVALTLLVGGIATGWALGRNTSQDVEPNAQLLVLVTLLAILVGVAWSSWTSTRDIESLHEARRQMRSILASAMDPVMTVDGVGCIRETNPAASQLFGIARNQLQGRLLGELVEDLGNDPVAWTEWSERRIRRPDGTVRVAAVIAQALPDSVYPRYTVTLNDLTERKRAERELALGDERLSLALSVAEQFVWDWHYQTEEIHVVTAGAPILGYTAEDTQSARHWWAEQIHPEDRSRVRAALDAHLATQTATFEAEYRLRHKSGEYRWVLSRGRVVERDAAGAATRIIGTTMDQTTRRALEQQLVQAQKMEALGQLAGGVAHDFNNALQSILSATDLLSLSPDERIGDNEADLAQIRMAAERAAGLTRQLLTFGRQRPTRPESIDLETAVVEVVRLIRRLIGPHIHIDTELSPDLPQVRADPALLEHAIINLAVNARDSMPAGGQLVLAAYAPASAPGWVHLEVRDTGSGMEEELIARIFEPFFTTKPPGRGTGLGLPMVYGFLQQAGGRIEVESVVGVGSIFRMVLPAEQVVKRDSPPAKEEPRRGNESVLLVEDESGIRALCGSALEELGYTVVEAECAESAIMVLEDGSDRIALVLTDVAMPGMGGLALGTWIAEHRPGLPVGYLSGYPQGAEADFAKIDPTVLLAKPFRLEALADLIRRLLERRPQPETTPR